MESQRPVALITGGAKRVGAEIARKMAREGFDVAITWVRSSSDAQTLICELRQIGARAVAICADLTDPRNAVSHIEREFNAHFTRIDLLVNNASLFEPGDLSGVSIEQLRRYQSLHVESPLLLVKTFAERLSASGGCIVNMVDILAEKPFPKYLAYCASKAALLNLTFSLARELAPRVTVNAIAPGVVDWPDDYTPDMREQYLRRVPLARAGSPHDVADLVYFLATAGKYVTGQVIRLDGGRSLT